MVKVGPAPATWFEVQEKLWANTAISQETNCFEWQGHTAGEGYGCICWQGKQVYIHRLVYEQLTGTSPNVVRHICDTPNCWNIDHLRDGTHTDNVADKVAKARHSFGTKNWNNKLTEDQVREIKSSDLTITALAKMYGVGKGTIHSILSGRSWGWL